MKKPKKKQGKEASDSKETETDAGRRSGFVYFEIIVGLFVAVLIISNIASTKILVLWKFTFDGGTLLFPLSYIFGDILTEVYGYKRSRKVIWIGFFCLVMFSLVLLAVQLLPAAVGWENQAAFDAILGVMPRIVLASLIAYFAGEFTNSYILAKVKVWMKGKVLWIRTIGSTIAGEGIDTLLFVIIAFYGVLPNELLIPIIVSNYIFKVGIEVLMTPVTYKVVSFLKRKENEDYYDYRTNFNPFKLRE